ncbi:MAG: type II toxin-antitoxin system RelE/ParE family toxin [Pyrinomonadaceae bacterium]
MTFELSFHPEARLEARVAMSFYRDIDAVVAAEFLKLYETAITQILLNPLACPILSGKMRRKLLRKFPYTIFYRFDTDEVRIIAVSHHKRSPGYWLKRS